VTLDELLKLLKAGASGAVGGAMGFPMDTAVSATNLSRAAYGYGGHKLGLLNAAQMPEPIEPKNVPGTSAHLSGLLGVGDSPKEQIAEMVGGLLAPGPKTVKQPSKMDWTAYHGSPHKFDKFSLDKIGTGEGKQQQGVGLYFADHPNVAQKYADKEAARRGMDAGFIYKVDIPDDAVAKMAQNDRPLREQPPAVRSAVTSMLDADARDVLRRYHGWDRAEDAPFAAVMDALETTSGARNAAASALRAAGVPGIRYLDQGSRSRGGGTYNTVLFDDSLVKILERQ
jgi:hypothetical protein